MARTGGQATRRLPVGEVLRSFLHVGAEPQMFFWRTARGDEVDVVPDHSGTLVPIEVRSSATPRPGMATGLASLLRDYPDKAEHGWLVHLGLHTLPLGPGITAIPFGGL